MKRDCIIETEYIYGLGSFLDEKNISWKNVSKEGEGDYIKIYLLKNSPTDIWNLAIEFKRWQERLDDTY